MSENRYPQMAPATFGQRGFSLVELMVAVALLAVILAGMTQLFVSTAENSRATEKLSRIEETGRIALQLLAADIRRAGYFGGFTGLTDVEGTLGDAAAATTCVANTTAWGRMVGQPLFGLNDTNTGYACILDSEYLRGDILTVRNTSATAVAVGSIEANRPYLHASLFEGKIFLGKDEANGGNNIATPDPQTFALVANSYYVGPSGRSCQGLAIPALFRKSIDSNGQPTTQELLAGVEHLQFKYRLGNQYVDADDIVDLADWPRVSAVEISVLVRAECPESGFVNNRTFPMGDLAAAYGPADGYRREVFTSSSALRN